MEIDDFVLLPRPGEPKWPAEELPEYLDDIDELITELSSQLWPINRFIHDNPELGYHETQAHDTLVRFMKSKSGWKVTPSAFGIETAWQAVYDTGRPGPVVNFNAEMDALPNLGHACGHNLIAVVSVAAAIATAEILSRQSLTGKVVLIGTPAEEGGGGKIKLLEAGAYEGIDVTLISHPGILNNSPMVRTTAFTHLDVEYHGRAAHAAQNPWDGINALDALITGYNAVSMLRQQTRPGDVIGLQITNGGNRPNVIHERAAAAVSLRAITAPALEDLKRKVSACFRAGAEATGATVQITEKRGYYDHMPNRVLARSYRRYWQALPDVPEPAVPPEGQFTFVKSATDQGNLSYALPSMNVSFAIPPGAERGQPHSPDFEKASRTREAFNAAMRVATAMAGTAVDVCSVPGMLKEVREQWKKDVGK